MTPYIIHSMPQGSPEWFAARAGKVTGSRIGDLLAKGQGKTRAAYALELALEQINGGPGEINFQSQAMRYGTDREPVARAMYEAFTDAFVDQVGFLESTVHPGLGVSPDGLVGDDGGVEIKCPTWATHYDTLVKGTIKRDYLLQIQACLLVTGRAWWDFVSYYPCKDESVQLYVKRVQTDYQVQAEILANLGPFLAEVSALVESALSAGRALLLGVQS